MNFKDAEVAYSELMVKHHNEIISEEEVLVALENLIVMHEETGEWKLAMEGIWLWYDWLNEEWIVRHKPGYKEEQAQEVYELEITTPEPPGLPDHQPSDGQKVCIGCGTLIDADSAFCAACGAKQEELEQISFCVKCGSELKKDHVFCTKCGHENK